MRRLLCNIDALHTSDDHERVLGTTWLVAEGAWVSALGEGPLPEGRFDERIDFAGARSEPLSGRLLAGDNTGAALTMVAGTPLVRAGGRERGRAYRPTPAESDPPGCSWLTGLRQTTRGARSSAQNAESR